VPGGDDDRCGGRGSYPSAPFLARIVRGLTVHGPQVIAIDMLFVDHRQPDVDALLARWPGCEGECPRRHCGSEVMAKAVVTGIGQASDGRPGLSDGGGTAVPEAPADVALGPIAWPDDPQSARPVVVLVHFRLPMKETAYLVVPMIFREGNWYTISGPSIRARKRAASAALTPTPVFSQRQLSTCRWLRPWGTVSGIRDIICRYVELRTGRGAWRQFSSHSFCEVETLRIRTECAHVQVVRVGDGTATVE